MNLRIGFHRWWLVQIPKSFHIWIEAQLLVRHQHSGRTLASEVFWRSQVPCCEASIVPQDLIKPKLLKVSALKLLGNRFKLWTDSIPDQTQPMQKGQKRCRHHGMQRIMLDDHIQALPHARELAVALGPWLQLLTYVTVLWWCWLNVHVKNMLFHQQRQSTKKQTHCDLSSRVTNCISNLGSVGGCWDQNTHVLETQHLWGSFNRRVTSAGR